MPNNSILQICILLFTFQIRVIQGGSAIISEKMPFPPGQVVKFTNIFNLAMTEDRKTVSITAINPLGLRSDDLLANLTVFVDKPIKSGKLPYDQPTGTEEWRPTGKPYRVCW